MFKIVTLYVSQLLYFIRNVVVTAPLKQQPLLHACPWCNKSNIFWGQPDFSFISLRITNVQSSCLFWPYFKIKVCWSSITSSFHFIFGLIHRKLEWQEVDWIELDRTVWRVSLPWDAGGKFSNFFQSKCIIILSSFCTYKIGFDFFFFWQDSGQINIKLRWWDL